MSAYYVFTQAAHEAAEPLYEAALADPTPEAVDVQDEYVYLLRVVEAPPAKPRAKIPLVLFPVADPQNVQVLAAPTPEAVDVSEE